MKKKFSEVKKGDWVKIQVDCDLFGQPIYTEVIAETDSIEITNEDNVSGYGFFTHKNFRRIDDGETIVEVLNEQPLGDRNRENLEKLKNLAEKE